jgi:hypothetical protein
MSCGSFLGRQLEHQIVYQVKSKVWAESFIREILPQPFEGLTRWSLFILRSDEQQASLLAAAPAGYDQRMDNLTSATLARIIHERFCCNRRSAAATGLRPAGSPLVPSPYCTSTHRGLRAPRAGLATRLSDFATNRHE